MSASLASTLPIVGFSIMRIRELMPQSKFKKFIEGIWLEKCCRCLLIERRPNFNNFREGEKKNRRNLKWVIELSRRNLKTEPILKRRTINRKNLRRKRQALMINLISQSNTRTSKHLQGWLREHWTSNHQYILNTTIASISICQPRNQNYN